MLFRSCENCEICQAVSQQKFATSDLVWESDTSGTEAVGIGLMVTNGPLMSTVHVFHMVSFCQAVYLMEGALHYQLGNFEAVKFVWCASEI